MQIITGIGESEHVTSMQHRAIFEMVIGNDSYILNKGELLKPELQSNNALKIRSGMLAHHGCISEVAPNTYDEVAIGNGSQNMKRIDLVVARYTQNAETKVERTEWTVIQGQPVESNPVAPDYIHGNMQDGDLTDDCPVFEVHLDGIQVVEIKKLLNVLDGSLAELNRNLPKLIVASSHTISYTPDRDCNVLVTYESCGWGFGGTTWQIEIAGSASSGDSPTRTNNKRGVFDGTDGIYKDVSTSAYFTGLRAGVTYTFSKETYAGSGGKEANPFMKLLAV